MRVLPPPPPYPDQLPSFPSSFSPNLPLFALFPLEVSRAPIPATQISFAFNFSRGIRDKCQSRSSPVLLSLHSSVPPPLHAVSLHPSCLPSQDVLSLPRIGSWHLRGSRGIKRRREDGRFSFYRSRIPSGGLRWNEKHLAARRFFKALYDLRVLMRAEFDN